MSQETEWFIEEEKFTHCYWRRIGFLVFFVLALAIILAPLAGCATAEPQVCFVKPMGATEDGSWVVAQMCMTPEAFAASQK